MHINQVASTAVETAASAPKTNIPLPACCICLATRGTMGHNPDRLVFAELAVMVPIHTMTLVGTEQQSAGLHLSGNVGRRTPKPVSFLDEQRRKVKVRSGLVPVSVWLVS